MINVNELFELNLIFNAIVDAFEAWDDEIDRWEALEKEVQDSISTSRGIRSQAEIEYAEHFLSKAKGRIEQIKNKFEKASRCPTCFRS
jgi:predicted adenine nucleotide alpha hydrolase (AANH) superfamily ATPase